LKRYRGQAIAAWHLAQHVKVERFVKQAQFGNRRSIFRRRKTYH